MSSKATDLIIPALEATGLPWSITKGGKHNKIILAGRMVGVFSKSNALAGDRHSCQNVLAQIRRAARLVAPQQPIST